MSLIPHSNIRVDNFEFMKNDFTQYTFFLSHCHEDHVKGLNPSWNYGKIYTSHISKVLILEKFPHLKEFVVELEMDEEHWIYLDETKKEGVSVILMDACHCPGAVMFLFRGKMGTVFHTGDFRFSELMFNNELVFPPEKRNSQMKQISVDIDYLFLDNTFADPEYDFPSREEAYKTLTDTVKAHKDHRIFMFSYHLGKEEVFVKLAEDFETLVVVDEDRYRKLSIMNVSPELFTTDPTQGWIHVKSIKDLKKFDIEECFQQEPTVFIILTGWNDKYNRNLPYYFKIPYSSHSNYRELERFVKALMPKNLVFNVPDRSMSEKRLNFQHHLIKNYVRKDQGSNQQPVISNPKKGYMASTSQNNISQNQTQLQKQVNKQEQLKKEVKQQAKIIEEIKNNQLLKDSSGYNCGDFNLTERFNVNNTELNKRRFMEQNAQIFKSKSQNGFKAKGAKFANQEIQFSLTPQGDEFDKLLMESREFCDSSEKKQIVRSNQGLEQIDEESDSNKISKSSTINQQLIKKISDQKSIPSSMNYQDLIQDKFIQGKQKISKDEDGQLLLQEEAENDQIRDISRRLFNSEQNYQNQLHQNAQTNKKRTFQEFSARDQDQTNENNDQEQSQKRMKQAQQERINDNKQSDNKTKINYLDPSIVSQLRDQYQKNKQIIKQQQPAQSN